LPDNFTGNRVGVESAAGETELDDGVLCCEFWHPNSVRNFNEKILSGTVLYRCNR
jgi:hypothetical protein